MTPPPTPEQIDNFLKQPGALNAWQRAMETRTIDFISGCHRDLRIMEAACDLRCAEPMLQAIGGAELECDTFLEVAGAQAMPFPTALHEMLKALRKEYRRVFNAWTERMKQAQGEKER